MEILRDRFGTDIGLTVVLEKKFLLTMALWMIMIREKVYVLKSIQEKQSPFCTLDEEEL